MSYLDTLATFNLPKYMLELLPIELWAIIYRWKHRLEIKDCLKEAIHYRRLIHTDFCLETCFDHKIEPAGHGDDHGFGGFSDKYGFYTGDIWYQNIFPKGKLRGMYASNHWQGRVNVNPRCGIELIPGSKYWNVIGCKESVRNHAIENLGLKCPKSWTKWKQISILRTV